MLDPHQAAPRRMQTLVQEALDGRLALPEFQRDFAWKPPAVRLLISSVALGWPIGSFMTWSKGQFELQSKDFDGVTGVKVADDADYLLDGQQRLTALIQALHPEFSKYRYFINGLVEFLCADAEAEIEDYVESLTVRQFAKKYPDLDAQAKADVALISDLVSDGKFERWIGSYKEQHPDHQDLSIFGLREQRLPSLKTYSIPCVQLGAGLELSAVARIFETTNRTGIKLGTVDLMTATLFPAFKLRDEWADVLKEHEHLREYFSNTLDEEDALRLLSYWKTEGKGITRDKILKMKHSEVRSRWADAIEALVQTIDFLREECGVVQGSLLPQRLMVIPIAVAFDRAISLKRKQASRQKIRAELRRWFWYAVSHGAFVRSTNTRAIRHAAAAEMYVEEETRSIRKEIGGNDGEGPEDLIERLMDSGRGERALEAAVLALVVARGGTDWLADKKPLPKVAGDIQAHHVIPQGADGADEWERVNCIANLTPQSRASNNQLGNKLPIDAGVTGDVAEAHLCDFLEIGATSPETFEKFVERRAREIANAMEQLAGTA